MVLAVSPLNNNPALAQLLLDANCYSGVGGPKACLQVYRQPDQTHADLKHMFIVEMSLNGDVMFANQRLLFELVATFQKYDEPDIINLRDDWPSKTYTFEIHPVAPN